MPQELLRHARARKQAAGVPGIVASWADTSKFFRSRRAYLRIGTNRNVGLEGRCLDLAIRHLAHCSTRPLVTQMLTICSCELITGSAFNAADFSEGAHRPALIQADHCVDP
jgi:hypothetical protein